MAAFMSFLAMLDLNVELITPHEALDGVGRLVCSCSSAPALMKALGSDAPLSVRLAVHRV